MVIKKPYAFLIKNFRLIHGLLFIMLIFLITKSVNVYSFFSSYAASHLYINEANLADKNVTFAMYLVAFLAVAIFGLIFYILSIKSKSNKIYLAGIVYYFILLVFFIYMHQVFYDLQEKALDVESVRAIRDVCLIITIPQVVFIFIVFGRTLGFNLKQFDFKRDLEELQIDTSDNEEVEVTLGTDTYKIARFFRKTLRLTKYFILENKLFVIGGASLIVIVLGVVIFKKFDVYRESINQNQDFHAASLWFNVKESYITNADINNMIISEGKHYVLVNVIISNKNEEDYNLSRDTFRLSVGKELIIPTYSMAEKFIDIGQTFSPTTIKSGEDKDVIVVFEIDSSNLSKEYILKVKNFDSDRYLSAENQYKDIIVAPSNLNENKDMGTVYLPNDIDFKDSILKESSLHISSYEIADRFKEKYKYTIDGKEHEATYSIIPSTKGDVKILKIEANMKIDDSVYMKKYLNTPADLFEYYGVVRFRYQGYYKNLKLKKIDVDFDKDNYAYMEIPKEIENANKIDLIILIRGIKYTINLK